MIWEITYRIVGDNISKTMQQDLHFTKKHEVGKWFKLNKNGLSGSRRRVEFVNAKIIE